MVYKVLEDDDLIYYYNHAQKFEQFTGSTTDYCRINGVQNYKKFTNMVYRFNPWTEKNIVNRQKELDLADMYLNDNDVNKEQFCQLFDIKRERLNYILMHVKAMKKIDRLKKERPDDFIISEMKEIPIMPVKHHEYTLPPKKPTMTFSAVWPESKEPEKEETIDIDPSETLRAHREYKMREAVEKISPPVVEQAKEPKNNEIEIIVNKEVKLILAPTLSSERLIKLIDFLKEI